MVRGLLGKLASRSLSVAGKWQQQQLRRLNIHEYQGAELMGKHGINVPKGVAVGSVEEVRKALQEVFPNQSELMTFDGEGEAPVTECGEHGAEGLWRLPGPEGSAWWLTG
ncbi:hypothetical protein CASFOL_022171 [Castilleja foliolosa]|uniref:Uncharacterized protein n=1 Tax=Castilleja foliolosa TaxID=1961234 RepID=A0ABD3CWF5_9LAMI